MDKRKTHNRRPLRKRAFFHPKQRYHGSPRGFQAFHWDVRSDAMAYQSDIVEAVRKLLQIDFLQRRHQAR